MRADLHAACHGQLRHAQAHLHDHAARSFSTSSDVLLHMRAPSAGMLADAMSRAAAACAGGLAIDMPLLKMSLLQFRHKIFPYACAADSNVV
jgi:hypothetical protein